MVTPELVFDAKARLGEGPAWIADKQQLIWVDIESKRIHVHDPADNRNHTIQLEQRVGAVVPTAEDGWIVALQNGLYRIREDGSSLEFIGDPESDKPNNRFNDGKCDPAGRFWAGTMPLSGGGPHGALYMLDLDGKIHKKVDQVSISNGLAWSPDRSTMYYVDTPTRMVFAFDYSLETGEIDNRRTVITIPDGEGNPDGMTIDAEGKLWVAHWGGWKVSRFDPDDGSRLAEYSLPAAHVTSCCFAGPDLSDLYITTARVGLSDEDLEKQPLAGGLFRVRTEVKGSPTYVYGKADQ